MSRLHRVPMHAGPKRQIAAAIGVAGATIVLALTASIQGCGRSASAESAPSRPVVTVVPEDVATVATRSLASGPIISGTLTARRRATVRAETGGSVIAVYADRGSVVAQGAPLLRVEGRALLDAQVATASDLQADEGALAIARRRLTRSEALLTGGAVAADDVEDARQALTAAEARVATARARVTAATAALARTLVRAPFAGVISARPVNAGDVVESGNILFELLDPTTMYVEGSVPSAQLESVRVGASVDVSVSAYPGHAFAGRVERVSPAADPSTRQLPVFVAVANPDGRLVAGLYAEGRVAPTSGPVLVVPSASITGNGGATSVVRFSAGRIERRVIETGARDADGTIVEVRRGLTLGDTVLLGVAQALPSGAAARVAGARSGTSSTPNER